jgi:hypothetical protein
MLSLALSLGDPPDPEKHAAGTTRLVIGEGPSA